MEFTEPLSDCRMLANRIGSENLKRTAGIEPSVRERWTASAPQAPARGQKPGGEQRPPRPGHTAAPREPQPGEDEGERAEGKGVAAAHGLELREELRESGPGRRRLRRGALALQPALDERRERARRGDDPRDLAAQVLGERANAGALAHALAPDRARGAPDSALGIRVPSRALDA